MTRIIAGQLRGREIKVPENVTRPTSSRVREAIFSAAEHKLAGLSDLRVLDLYSGSGAYAIEAISRGAAQAVAIEKENKATQIIKQNCVDLKIDNLSVVTMDVAVALANPPQFGKFDLVFIDPPYAFADEVVSAQLAELTNGWLHDGAVVIVERNKKSQIVAPAQLGQVSQKVYGDTSVWYGQYEEINSSNQN